MSLTNIDRYKQRDLYAGVFARVLESRTFADVSRAFDEHKIWYSKVCNYDDLASDPQAEALGAFREIDVLGEKVTMVNHPIRYNGQTPEIRYEGVRIGEHTRDILGELGFSSKEIETFVERGVVGAP